MSERIIRSREKCLNNFGWTENPNDCLGDNIISLQRQAGEHNLYQQEENEWHNR